MTRHLWEEAANVNRSAKRKLRAMHHWAEISALKFLASSTKQAKHTHLEKGLAFFHLFNDIIFLYIYYLVPLWVNGSDAHTLRRDFLRDQNTLGIPITCQGTTHGMILKQSIRNLPRTSNICFKHTYFFPNVVPGLRLRHIAWIVSKTSLLNKLWDCKLETWSKVFIVVANMEGIFYCRTC